MNTTASSDRDLVRQILDGQRDAFATLVERYLQSALAIARARLLNPIDADDAVQEAFLRAFAQLRTLREPAKFGPWLLTIVRHEAARFVVRRKSTLGADATVAPEAATTPDPSQQEVHALLRSRIEQLPESAREVLLLHYFAGRSTREIAELLGLRQAAVLKRLQRAREALAENLLHELETERPSPAVLTKQAARIAALAGAAGIPATMASAATTAATAAAGLGLGTKTAVLLIVAGCAVFAALQLRMPNTETGLTPPATANATNVMDEAAEQTQNSTSGAAPREASTSASNQNALTARGQSGSGRIYGTITFPEDAPVGLEATIEAHLVDLKRPVPTYEDTLRGTATIHADGEYEFNNLPYGDYVVVAETDGYAQYRETELSPRQSEAELILAMWPSGNISGRVVNETGEPVAGAHIFTVYYNMQGLRQFLPRGPALAGRHTTNANGEFVQKYFRNSMNKEPGFLLAVKAEGYATYVSDFLQAGATGAEFVLSRGHVVSGRLVRADNGEPLPNCVVAVASQISIENLSSTTDAGGYFFFPNIGSGIQSMYLPGNELVLTEESNRMKVSTAQRTDDVVLKATLGGSISGRVTDSRGAGVGRLELMLDYDDQTETFAAQATSNTNGAYRFAGLAPGPHRITYEKPEGYAVDYAQAQTGVVATVELGKDVSGPAIVLSRGIALAGHVVDESGKPVSGAEIIARTIGNDPNFTHDTTRSKRDGSFIVAGFTPKQKVEIQVSKRGFANQNNQDVQTVTVLDMDSTDLKRVLVHESTASGKIVNEAGEPMAGIRVYAVSVVATDIRRTGTSASDGSVTVRELAEGEYAFVFRYPDGQLTPADTAQRFHVETGEHLKDLSILYAPRPPSGLMISGRVLDTQGNGVARADVQISGPNGFRRELRADSNGNYVFYGLTTGEYQLIAFSYSRSGTDVKTAQAGSSGVNFTLKDLASIKGHVVSARTGEPITSFMVRAQVSDNARPSFVRDSFLTIKDPNGFFILPTIDDGSPMLYVRAAGYIDADIPLSGVVAGKTIEDFVVKLDDSRAVTGVVRDPSGNPVAGAEIYLNHQWPDNLQSTTGADGAFRLASLASGQLKLIVAHPKFIPATIDLNAVRDKKAPLVVTLQPGQRISGVVTYGGKPYLGEGDVSVQYQSSTIQADLGSDGTFELGGLASGATSIQAGIFIGDTRIVKSIPVEIGVTDVITIDIERGTASLEGGIYRTKGQLQTQNAIVYALIVLPDGTRQVYAGIDEGLFRYENLPAGAVELTATGFGDNGPQSRRTRTLLFDLAQGEQLRKDVILDEDPH